MQQIGIEILTNIDLDVVDLKNVQKSTFFLQIKRLTCFLTLSRYDPLIFQHYIAYNNYFRILYIIV